MADGIAYLAGCAFAPHNRGELATFYSVWFLLYCGIHIGWDACSKRTPKLELHHLKDKTGTLFSASTFCSSLLVVFSVWDTQVRNIATDYVVPFLITGGAGLFFAIGEISPYSKKARGSDDPS